MALTEERLKEIETEVGSQPYSVVLGLVFEIRYLRKELKESREATLEERKQHIDQLTTELAQAREALEYVKKGATVHRQLGMISIPSIALDKVEDALKSPCVPTP